jgi:hemin uptake protein HemP
MEPKTVNSHDPRSFSFSERRTLYRNERPEPLRFPTRTVASEALFRGDHEIGIEHHGALYRLKITRQGKLILNK